MVGGRRHRGAGVNVPVGALTVSVIGSNAKVRAPGPVFATCTRVTVPSRATLTSPISHF